MELKNLLKAVTSVNANYARWAMRNGTNGLVTYCLELITGDLEDNNSHPKALGEQAFSSPASIQLSWH